MNNVQATQSTLTASSEGTKLLNSQTSQAKRVSSSRTKSERSKNNSTRRSNQSSGHSENNAHRTTKGDSRSEKNFDKVMRTHRHSENGASGISRSGRRSHSGSGLLATDALTSGSAGAESVSGLASDAGYSDILSEELGYDDALVEGQDYGESGSTDYLSELGSYLANVAQLRQDMLEDRMQQGLDSGRITDTEQQELETKMSASDDLIADAMEDGYVSGQELSGIIRAQNAARRAIFKYRNNGDSTLSTQASNFSGTSQPTGTLNVTT